MALVFKIKKEPESSRCNIPGSWLSIIQPTTEFIKGARLEQTNCYLETSELKCHSCTPALYGIGGYVCHDDI